MGAKTSTETEERPIQICFDFTKGRCARRNCKFSHDFDAIVKYNSKEQGICFDFLRGECTRGPLCRFSHDLSNVMKQWMHDIRMGNASQLSTSGICYDFVRGQCPRGKKCRFSHDLREIAMATSRENNEETNNSSINIDDRNHAATTTKSSAELPKVAAPVVKPLESYMSHQSSCAFIKRPYCAFSIWKTANPKPPITKDTSHLLLAGNLLFQSVKLNQHKEQNMRKDFNQASTKPLPLANIRSRELLGHDLCRVIGIPTLNSTLTVTW